MGYEESKIEGRNAVLEAFRSGKTIDKLYVLDGCQDGPVRSITREARKHDTIINYVAKERLDQISETGKHQGVIAVSAAYEYAEVEDILAAAEAKGEPPFIIILDGIEDPHNLGAILRTANQVGAHGVIIPKRRAVGLTPTVARTSAGAINYTPVAKVTNISNTMKELKDKGMWFVCADMDGTVMYNRSQMLCCFLHHILSNFHASCKKDIVKSFVQQTLILLSSTFYAADISRYKKFLRHLLHQPGDIWGIGGWL